MKGRQERLDGLLQDLAKERGVLGASLVSRDGLAVKTAGNVEMNRETFSAMSATLVGAAEIALAEVDGGKPRSIVCHADRVRLVLVGATHDLLLVAYANGDASLDALVPRLESAARDVAAIVSG
ncbi:MAG TPA: roadblock/LC7 domain-containing protein [Candidatus Thermoplasmatota archaeon]|nr:roadblock/LC7 domain-containing protein [Candidatus Thermoplasmatota archaeon]